MIRARSNQRVGSLAVRQGPVIRRLTARSSFASILSDQVTRRSFNENAHRRRPINATWARAWPGQPAGWVQSNDSNVASIVPHSDKLLSVAHAWPHAWSSQLSAWVATPVCKVVCGFNGTLGVPRTRSFGAACSTPRGQVCRPASSSNALCRDVFPSACSNRSPRCILV